MSEHTPGPWVFAIDDKWIYIGEVGYADYRNAFAKVDYDDVDHDTALANARLIACAPELLAVVRDFMENPLFQVAVGGNPTMVDDFMERARAAIAKATTTQIAEQGDSHD